MPTNSQECSLNYTNHSCRRPNWTYFVCIRDHCWIKYAVRETLQKFHWQDCPGIHEKTVNYEPDPKCSQNESNTVDMTQLLNYPTFNSKSIYKCSATQIISTSKKMINISYAKSQIYQKWRRMATLRGTESHLWDLVVVWSYDGTHTKLAAVVFLTIVQHTWSHM